MIPSARICGAQNEAFPAQGQKTEKRRGPSYAECANPPNEARRASSVFRNRGMADTSPSLALVNELDYQRFFLLRANVGNDAVFAYQTDLNASRGTPVAHSFGEGLGIPRQRHNCDMLVAL